MSRPTYIDLYYTRRSWELDKLQRALEESEIPCHVRENFLSGTSGVFPLTPAQSPIAYWSVLVPNSFVDQALDVLMECGADFRLDPLTEEFATTPWLRTFSRYYSLIPLLLTLAYGIVLIITSLGHSGSLL